MIVRLCWVETGLIEAIQTIAPIIKSCDNNSQLLLLPSKLVRTGIGILSTIGAQTNLKEYPRAAQLKKVTVDLLTPASVSQTERVEKISRIGIPAEKPRNSMVMTLGWVQAVIVAAHDRFLSISRLIVVFFSHSDYFVQSHSNRRIIISDCFVKKSEGYLEYYLSFASI